MRCVRSDGYRTIGTVGDTPRGTRGWLSDAVVAECAGFHLFKRSEPLDVQAGARAKQLNGIRARLRSGESWRSPCP